MGASASSRLLWGIVGSLRTEIVEKEFSRFDPMNGTPMTVFSDSFNAFVSLEQSDKEIQLPAEEKSIEELVPRGTFYSSDKERHVRSRSISKLRNLINNIGVMDYEWSCKDQIGLKLVWECRTSEVFNVGVVIVEGDSWKDNKGFFGFDVELIKNAQEVFDDQSTKLAELFEVDHLQGGLLLETRL